MFKEEILIETMGVETLNGSSDYETEHDKPMPNKLHAILQSSILTQLSGDYGQSYDVFSELSLDTKPGSTPDISICPRSEKFIRKDIEAKESEPPLTTIEIISPSQTLDEMTDKIRDIYFPMGVKSAWLVAPSLKAILVMLPGGENLFFDHGNLKDPVTGIELSVDKVFERVV